MRFKYWMLILSVFLLNGCDLFEGENQILTKEALLIWSGDYAVDGCGFSLEFDNKKYKPENEDIIPSDFKNNSQIKVKIRFKYLHKEIEYYCGFQIVTDEGIEIIKISKI